MLLKQHTLSIRFGDQVPRFESKPDCLIRRYASQMVNAGLFRNSREEVAWPFFVYPNSDQDHFRLS